MSKPKARTFTKTIDGEQITQVTRTPSEAVRYVYEGWREVTDEVAAAAQIARQATAPAAKPAPKK